MIAYSQSENNTQVKDQAEQKLFELAQKFNTMLKDSKVNLKLPQGEELHQSYRRWQSQMYSNHYLISFHKPFSN